MSDTPRTDAQDIPALYGHVAPTSFARQLERELNAARNEIARLNGQTCYACQCGGTKLEAQERDEWKACAEELAYRLGLWRASDNTMFCSEDASALAEFEKVKGKAK